MSTTFLKRNQYTISGTYEHNMEANGEYELGVFPC